MKPRSLLLYFVLTFFLCLPAFAQHDFQQTHQTNNVPDQQIVVMPAADSLQIINSSENPDFSKPRRSETIPAINVIKSLVPYEDLYKVLQKDAGKYFILPIEEFEALKKAKETWLASSSTPVADPPPLLYQVNSARLSGHLEDNFAFIDASFKIETYTDSWHEIPLFWGSLAVEAVTLNGRQTTLKTSGFAGQTRQVQFGKLSQQNILQNTYGTFGSANDTLSQNNWKDTMFSLPVSGKGAHECKVSFVVPVQNIDDLFTMQFNMTRIPLAFMQLKTTGFILSIDSTTFKDFSILENQTDSGCEFIGWLGANSDVSIKWRRKFAKLQPKETLPPEAAAMTAVTASETPASITVAIPEEQPKPVVQPLLYVRSHTLASLAETSIYVSKTFDYTISKAPVTGFSFRVPDEVEIVAVTADRPQTHRMVREGNQKRLRVEFSPGREDVCQIEISYEAPVDLSSTLVDLPEVSPVGIERELGTIAIEALTSVEIQPGNNKDNPLNKGVYPLDQLEVPQPLKDRATRPLLLAWRQNAGPAGIKLSIKRYQDVTQQTVVADSMDVKTTFTTNRSSNTLLTMNIRNNNKQYLQLQLASGAEVLSTFCNGTPVRPGNSRLPGVIQIPLEMSQTIGEPVDMNLQIMIKEPVDEIKWRGKLSFAPPLVDIPVSRFSWYLYAPEDYHLYDFVGTVKDPLSRKDPFFFRGFMHLLRAAWSILRHPDTIAFFVFAAIIVLAIFSRQLLLTILRYLWSFICSVFGFIFGGKGFRLVELMIVVVIIAVLAAMAIPNFRKAREQARDKACFVNQRVLTGSVEMYNMDNPENPMVSLNIDQLLDGKYMKSRPTYPERGCQYLNNGNLAAGGYIYCRLHGSPDAGRAGYEAKNEVSAALEVRREKSLRKDSFDAMMPQTAGKPMALSEADKAAPSQAAGGFGAARPKGMLPIKMKFTMTKNFYTFERDLVMAEIASDGALLANSTCPSINLKYVWSSVLSSAEIIAFVLALFSAMYFVAGAFLRMPAKISFAALLIVLLSVFDLKLKSIGDAANAGFWLAIAGAFVWKTIWLFSFIKLPESDASPPSINIDSNTPPNSGRIGVCLTMLLAAIIFSACSVAAFASTPREIRVMAPFQDLNKVLPSADRAVIVPESDYNYLKDITPEKVPEIVSPNEYRFESVKYHGVVEEKGVRFSASFKLDLFNAGWKKVGLLSTDAIPSSASIDDKPLSMTLIDNRGETAYGFMTNASGPVMINVEFFIPMSSSEYRHSSRFTLNMIPVCISSLQITVNEKDCEAWIDPGVLRNSEKTADKTVFKAILPPTQSVNFELYRNTAAAKPAETLPIEEQATDNTQEPVVIEEKTRVTVRQHNLLHFKEGFVSGINTFELKIMGGAGIADCSFQIPERIRILKIENKLIEDWKLVEENDKRRLDIIFKSKIRGNTELTVEFEEDIQNLKDGNYLVPEIIPLNVEQSWGLLGIGCINALEISVTGITDGYSSIVAGEFLKGWNRERPEKTPYAFKFLRHPNNLELVIARPEDIEQQTAVIDRAEAMTLLNEDGYLLTRVVYEVRNNSEQFLKVKLPQIGSHPTELWSTQVAGLSVRSGFDQELGVYNLPIVRSTIERGESRPFPVEIVYAFKFGNPLAAFNQTYVELPSAHLPISELSWIVYLPEGYELMREKGNVDRLQKTAETRFLNNTAYFSSLNTYSNIQKRQQSQLQIQTRQSEKVFGQTGLLPVKFKIPTTNWPISFSMLQIDPTGRAPFIEGMLVNPRKGKGFWFQLVMILVGILAAIGVIKMFTSKNHYKWFLVTALQGIILAIAVYLKLYQADHFVQLGFSAAMAMYLLYRFFKFKPAAAESSGETS